MNKYSNGCAAHDMREVQLMNKIHGLEVRNARMREALKKASDIFLAMDCDCCSLTEDEECLRCYGMDSMTAALEAGKVDG